MERAFGTHSQHCFAQPRITFLQAGKYPASLRNRFRCDSERRKIAAQRIGGKLVHLNRHHRHVTGKPDVKIVIERAVGKKRDLWRQHQCRFIPQWLVEFFFTQGHSLPQAQPVAGGSRAGGSNLHGHVAAKAAKADGKLLANIAKLRGLLGIMRP